MGTVVVGDFNTRLDLPPDRVLEGARVAALEPLVVVGRTPDGAFYLAGTTADAGKLLILLERAKRTVLSWVD